jgi:hypothetical protein
MESFLRPVSCSYKAAAASCGEKGTWGIFQALSLSWDHAQHRTSAFLEHFSLQFGCILGLKILLGLMCRLTPFILLLLKNLYLLIWIS